MYMLYFAQGPYIYFKHLIFDINMSMTFDGMGLMDSTYELMYKDEIPNQGP